MLGPTRPRRVLTKSDYNRRYPRLQDRLSELQYKIRDSDRTILIVLEGPDASGKSTLAGRLQETLDPRGFRVWHTYAPESHEIRRPWLWRFWMRTPRCGAIACFDRSWYGRVLIERVEELIPNREIGRAYGEIGAFERTLMDAGAVIVKLLFNLSRKEQRARFDAFEADPNQSWKIKKEDWRSHAKFGRYQKAFEDMVRRTSSARAPWTILPADDRRTAEIAALETIARRVGGGLK